MRRLLNSMVTIIDDYGVKKVKVANPSINDFLRSYINRSEAIINTILERAKSIYQYRRLIANDFEYNKRLKKLFEDHSILDFEFHNQEQKNGFITYYCSKNNIYDATYIEYINDYLKNITSINTFEKQRVFAESIFADIFQVEFCKFYGLNKLLENPSSFKSIIANLTLEEFVVFIKEAYYYFDSDKHEEYSDLIDSMIFDKVYDYSDIDVSDYDLDVSEILAENTHLIDDGISDLDRAAATLDIEAFALDAHLDWINGIISGLPSDYSFNGDIDSNAFSISGAESLIDSYMAADYEDYRDDIPDDIVSELNQIDNLFNWDD